MTISMFEYSQIRILKYIKLFSSNWNYKIFNKNGVFHTTSCEVVQTILVIFESILMLKALSRKEHNIASTKKRSKIPC